MGTSLAWQCQVSDLTMMLHMIDLESRTTRRVGLLWAKTGWRQSHLNRLSSWNDLWWRNYQRHAVLVMEDPSSQICRVWIWSHQIKRSRWDRNIRMPEIPRPHGPSHRELITLASEPARRACLMAPSSQRTWEGAPVPSAQCRDLSCLKVQRKKLTGLCS